MPSFTKLRLILVISCFLGLSIRAFPDTPPTPSACGSNDDSGQNQPSGNDTTVSTDTVSNDQTHTDQ